MKKVVIIDGLNMFLRSYIINPTMDPKGQCIGGCVGFLKSLQKICRENNPDEVVIAWDGHGGSEKKRLMNKDYKEGRAPLRFNRRMIRLDPKEEEINKAYQHIRLMEYLNEMPVIQTILDYVEADDVIAYLVQHEKYKDWNKLIVSSDRDFFQLVSDRTSLYRPIQKTMVDKNHLLDKFGIHPYNFALARSVAGDQSDNLKGVGRVGLGTLKNRFGFLAKEKVCSVDELVQHCESVEKPLQCHRRIAENRSVVEKNYEIMQLYRPNISYMGKKTINYNVVNFEPEFNKLSITKLLFSDGQGSMNLDALYRCFRAISETNKK